MQVQLAIKTFRDPYTN